MPPTTRRPVAIAAATIALAFVAAVLPAAAASAATPVVPGPSPLSAPGPVLAAPFSGMTNSQAGMSLMLYKMAAAAPPEFWAAMSAKQNGATLTSQQVQTITIGQNQGAPVATKLATAGKTVGGAFQAITALASGFAVGTAALQLFGVDTAGMACSFDGGTGWASVLYGQSAASCAAAATTIPSSYPANAGEKGGTAGQRVCSPDGVACAQWVGRANIAVADRRSVECWLVENPAGYVMTSFYESASRDGMDGSLSGYVSNYNQLSFYRDACAQFGANAVTDQTHATLYPSYQIRPSGAAPGVGTVGTVGQSTGDPSRILRCEITLTGGQVFTGDSQPFTEGSGQLPAYNCPQLPSGFSPTRVRILEVGGASGTVVLYDQTTTPEYQQAQQAYPDCASSSCMLDLQRNGVSCFSGIGSTCSDWWTTTTQGTAPGPYTCLYGTHSIPLPQCAVYAPTWTPEGLAGGTTYGDPTTGATLAPQAVASPQSGTSTGTASSACWPSGWGVFNPFNWVYQPVVCAARALFVPSGFDLNSISARVSGVTSNSALGQVGMLVLGLGAVFNMAATGCQGPPLEIHAFGVDYVGHPMDACSQPMASTAAGINGMLTFALTIVAVLAAVRYIVSTIGYVRFGSEASAGPAFVDSKTGEVVG